MAFDAKKAERVIRFIECLKHTKENGYSAFMTPFVWMFIKSYEKLREYIIQRKSITTLIQMEYSAFEEATVPICTFVLRNSKMNYAGNYLRLSDFKGGMAVQDEKVLEAQNDLGCKYRYIAQQENFKKIPGMPVAYWVSEKTFASYESDFLFEGIGNPKVGMQTSNNDKYLRLWYEINFSEFGGSSLNGKWIKYLKGGQYRKWYGNLNYLLFYNKDAQFILKQPNARVQDVSYQNCDAPCLAGLHRTCGGRPAFAAWQRNLRPAFPDH